MAIQRYDSPQVGNAPLEAARLNPGMAPNPGVVGQGLQHAAEGFGQIIQEAGTIKGEGALTKLREKQQEYTQWVQTLNGEKAFDPEAYGGAPGKSLHETALGRFDAAVTETGMGLSGHALEVYRTGAARFRLEFGGHVQQHETRESAVVAKDTYTGVSAVEDQNITQNGLSQDGRIQFDTINQSVARKVHAAQQLSDWLGEGPDMRQARQLEAKSSAYSIVLEGLLQRNNTQGAQVFFDAHRDSLDRRVVIVMEGKIQQAALANDVQTKADEIEARGLTLDQQDAMAREAFKGNVDGQKALQSELEHRFSVKRTAQTAAIQEVTGKLWDMRFPTLPNQRSRSMPDIMRTPEWSALNGTERNELRVQWESYSKRNESDPATRVAKFATFMDILDNPASLISLSDFQIASMTGTLGADYTMKLMEMKRKAAGDLETLKANTLNDIPFRDIAGEYGLKTKGALAQEDLAKLGSLRDQALDAIRYEQQATGKVLGPERKEEILRKLLVSVVTKPENAFQKNFVPGDWNDRAPLFEAVRSKPVPLAFIDIMNAKMKALGRPAPSPLELSKLWIEARAKGLVDEQGNQKP
ncbi:hypothetical protein [Geothrix sp. SG200]|uniref:hypothetical protein n=1 Tax=Geothrix sp. SG200 TaxID=2922865 RepID=UPI001FAC1714|nr:hypothetical protein [Geothrix sp. SG200]